MEPSVLLAKLGLNDPSVTEANLFQKLDNEEMVNAFIKAMNGNTSLKVLKIGSNGLGDENFKKIVETIFSGTDSNLEQLDISYNDLTSVGIEYLLEKLKTCNHKLTRIVTLGNEVEESHISSIISIIDINKAKSPRADRSNENISSARRRKTDSNNSLSSSKKKSSEQGRRRKKKTKFQIPVLENQDSLILRSHLLQKKIDECQSNERDYIAYIEYLEAKVKQLESLSSGSQDKAKLKLRNLVPFKSKKSKKLTVTLGNPIVGCKIASAGGSSAAVYSCVIEGWQCAMKELDISDMNEMTIENFEREIRILELLPRHSNIVRYLSHEYSNDNTKIRLFMTQYSASLSDYIKEQERPIPPLVICQLLQDIILGLDFLHSKGIIHRDLKSANIFILRDENKNISSCAIGDFDTAKQLTSKNDKAITVLGTPSWMAPEVMAANDSTDGYGTSCDIYSFGMVLYELLALKAPYENENMMVIINNVTQGKKPDLPPLSAEYSFLLELYERCTAFEPSKRPSAISVKQSVSMFIANRLAKNSSAENILALYK